MSDENLEILSGIKAQIQRINSKLKLLFLIKKAKEEYTRNNYEDCLNSCKEILKTNPNNAVALRGIGCVMKSKGDFSKALEYYNEALKNSEHKEIEYTLIGTIYYLQDDLDNAIENYNRAIDANDNYDSAYEGRNQAMLENHLKIADFQEQLDEYWKGQ